MVTTRPYFILKLLYGSSGYRQPVTAGMDTGSKTIGVAAVANRRVLYQALVIIVRPTASTARRRFRQENCSDSASTTSCRPLLGMGFVKGKRSSGQFPIADVFGNVIHASVDMREARRLTARTSTIAQRVGAFPPNPLNGMGLHAKENR